MGRSKKASDQKVEEPAAIIESTSTRTRGSTKPETVPEVKKTKDSKQEVVDDLDISSSKTEEELPTKRKRGRPANTSEKKKQKVIDPSIPKRGRGRPKKIVEV